MAKRVAEKELNHDNWDHEDEEEEVSILYTAFSLLFRLVPFHFWIQVPIVSERQLICPLSVHVFIASFCERLNLKLPFFDRLVILKSRQMKI